MTESLAAAIRAALDEMAEHGLDLTPAYTRLLIQFERAVWETVATAGEVEGGK